MLHGFLHKCHVLRIRMSNLKEGASMKLQKTISFMSLVFSLLLYFRLEDNYLTIVMVFATHQHELAIGIHMSLPSWTPIPSSTPSHPSKLSESTDFEFPASYIRLPVAMYFTYGNVYVSMLFSQIIPPLLPSLCPKVCSLWLCLFCCPAYMTVNTIFPDSIYTC